MQQARGYNPYKMGVVGASDSHNTVIPYSQANNFGSHGFMDASPKARLAGQVESGMAILQTGTSGLGGVWAGGEHARGDLRRDAAQGDLRHQRRAHQGADVRRLGLRTATC